MTTEIRDVQLQIREIIDRETRAWDTKDVDLLLSVFHEDMVWPWPAGPTAHDPAQWVLEWGRYNHDRWRRGWQTLFDTHELAHNRRKTGRVEVSAECDGESSHWCGRACKVYTMTARGWKMIAQTGLLDYSTIPDARS